MAIKSIVEMKAKPGRRNELMSARQQISAGDAPGFIAAQHYRNIEDEDTVIGIYDWKSNEELIVVLATRGDAERVSQNTGRVDPVEVSPNAGNEAAPRRAINTRARTRRRLRRHRSRGSRTRSQSR